MCVFTDFRCRSQCFQLFTEDDQLSILVKINQMESKTIQDVYLQSLIERHDVKERRPRKEDSKQRGSSYKYFVMHGTERVSVCQKAYLSLHCVSEKRVRRLQSLLLVGKTPKELRGKAHRPTFEISAVEIQCIDDHIRSFPTKTSHYSSREKTYLDAKLNVKLMHSIFITKYPDSRIKYEYYLNYFHENFAYSFGRPQVDTCITCEELGVKLRSPTLNDVAKRVAAAEQLVHKRRAKKFYRKMKEIEEKCKDDDTVKALCFDFMQNLPLPEIPVQDMFYLRQLWVYVFGIHELRTNKAKIFVYHEGEAKKGANEVCSMLLSYINDNIGPEIKELHLFCDGCTGQNRNHAMAHLLLVLVTLGRFKKIYQYYPERGHSYLPCDRDFALIKRKVKRADRVYLPDEYITMILAARQHPFDVKKITSANIINVSDWWPTYYKKTCVPMEKLKPGQKRDPKDSLAITANKMYTYDADEPVILRAHELIDGLINRSYRLIKGNPPASLPTECAYKDQVPIKEKKIQDIRKVLQHIPEEHLPFYNEILVWKTTTADYDTDAGEDE